MLRKIPRRDMLLHVPNLRRRTCRSTSLRSGGIRFTSRLVRRTTDRHHFRHDLHCQATSNSGIHFGSRSNCHSLVCGTGMAGRTLHDHARSPSPFLCAERSGHAVTGALDALLEISCDAQHGEPGSTLWQRHHWDRQLRSGETYGDKWEYVRSNPIRHGYIADADDWPYQRELNVLRW
jgi:hypothetical protein